MRLGLIGLLIITSLLVGCEKIALMTTPKKEAIPSHSPLSQLAEKTFWETLHQGNYAGIPHATMLLTAAYLQNPNDPTLAAHLGFLHIWMITERERNTTMQPTIVDQLILSEKYFADAIELNPHDARFQGFYGDTLLIDGKLFNNQRTQVSGYFQLKRAIAMWPQFNYFTAGYPLSTLDPHSKRYQEALDWQWKTLSLCAHTSVTSKNPDFRPYLWRETQTGPDRACWNSWIAPHNFEGFFLNMGDMLVKAGDWPTAIKIYKNAQLSRQYQTWPYRYLLEKRIADAHANVTRFQHPNHPTPESTILFDSGYGCVACHQTR